MTVLLKDYKFLLTRSQYINIIINGKKEFINAAIRNFPNIPLTKEMIAELERQSIDDFFNKIEDISTEKELKEFVFYVTTNNPKENDRKHNVQFVLNLFEEYDHKISEERRSIIEEWAIKYLKEENVNNSDLSQTGNEYGPNYARLNYERIKKHLPIEGTIAGAIRSFNNTLSKQEVRNLSKVIGRMLEQDKIFAPYRLLS